MSTRSKDSVGDLQDDRQRGTDGTTAGGAGKSEDHPSINEGQRLRAILAGLTMCMGSLAMGTVLGYPSPALADLNDHRNPFHTNDDQSSWIGSVITLGGMAGGLASGPLMDAIGRKTAIMFCLVPFMVGWLIVEASGSFACMLVGRLLTGLCSGLVLVVVPVYLGEVAPPSVRGMLGSCHQLGVTLGILFAYVFGTFLPWNWLAVACSAFPLIMMLAAAAVPETPRWLLGQGRADDATEALQWLRGAATDTTNELTEINDNLRKSQGNATLREFAQPHLWKPLLIALGLMVFQQFSGTNVVMFFIVDIFAAAHVDLDENVQSIIVGVAGTVGTLVSVFIADLAGRKVLLLVSSAIMGLAMAGLGAFFYEQEFGTAATVEDLFWLPVFCLVLYNFGFNVAFGPIPWVMMGELFPLRAKGPASSVCIGFNWLCAFLLTKFWLDITDVIGIYGGFWMCCGFCVLSVPFILWAVPETKGSTLEEIEERFK